MYIYNPNIHEYIRLGIGDHHFSGGLLTAAFPNPSWLIKGEFKGYLAVIHLMIVLLKKNENPPFP